MFQLLFARETFSESANTPALEVFVHEPPRKGSADLPPFFSFSLSLLALITQGPAKMLHRILVCFCRDFLPAVCTMELLCVFLLRLLGLPLGAYPASDHTADFYQLSRPDLIFL